MAFSIAEAFVDLKSRGVKELNREFDRGSNRLRSFANQADRAGKRITDSSRRASNSMGRFVKGIDSASGGFGSLGRAGSGVLSNLAQKTGLARLSMLGLSGSALVATGAVAGIVLAFAKGLSAAAAFEASLINVATISRDVRQNFSEVGSQVLRISQRVNLDNTLLNAGLYQTVSAGITDTSEALKFLETAAISARGGLTDVRTSVDVLTSVINAYGKQSSDATLISDQLFKTVELGKTTFGELARSMGNVAPIASQVGVSLEQVLAALAAITITGQSTGQAVTGLRAILAALLKPTASAEKEAKKLGFAFNLAALRSQGLQGFLEGLKKATGGSETSMAKFFESIEALSAVMVLTGSQADTFKTSIDEIANAAGVTKTAFDLQNSTFSATASLLKNELNVLFTELGNVILPAATKSVGFLAKSVSFLTDVLRDLKDIGPALQEGFQNLSIGSVKQEIEILGTTSARAIEEFNQKIKRRAAQGLPTPGAIGFRPEDVVQERRLSSAAQFDPNQPISIILPQQTVQRQRQQGVPTGARRGLQPSTRARLVSAQPQQGAVQTARDDTGFVQDFSTGIEQQNVTVEEQNRLVGEAIDLYGRWLVTIEGVSATATERLMMINDMVGQQGLVLVDTEANLEFLGDGWKTYRNIVIPLNRQIAQASARGAQPMLDFLKDIGDRKPREVKKGMESIGDSIGNFFGESIQGFTRMNEEFNKFNAMMEARAVRSEARLLELSGDRLNAQLILLSQRTEAELSEIDRTVTQTEIAESRKTRIIEQANRQRKVIFREGLGAVPQIGDLAQRVTRQQGEIMDIDFGQPPTDADRALKLFTTGLVDSAKGTSRGMRALEATIQGGQAGGLIGALAGLGVAVISETEGFARLTESLDPLFDSLINAIDPVISALADSFGPALEAVAEVLIALQPLFELIGKALNLVLKPVEFLGKAIGGVAKFFDFKSESEKAFRSELELELGDKQIAKQQATDEVRLKRIKDARFRTDEQVETGDTGRRTGFTIANITGPTRDILVAALSPLKQLDTTFPLMLDELRMIRFALSGEPFPFEPPTPRGEPNAPIIMVTPPSTERRTGTGGVGPNIIFPRSSGVEPAVDETIGGKQRRGEGGIVLEERRPPIETRQRQITTTEPVIVNTTGRTPRITTPTQGTGINATPRNFRAAPAVRMPEGDFSPRIRQPTFNREDISANQNFAGETSITVNEVNVSIDQVSDLSINEIVDQVNAELQRDLRITRRQVGTNGRRGRLSTSSVASL